MAPAFVWTRVDGSPALWVIFVRRRTGSDDSNLLRVVTEQWGARVVPAGAAIPFKLRLHFFHAGRNGEEATSGILTSLPPRSTR
jgi:hypothetical protein